MRRSVHSHVHPRIIRVVCAAAVLVPALWAASGQALAGVVWRALTLDQALNEAKDKNTMVMVDIWAKHCGSCGQMDIDVWETELGTRLADGLIPLKIDSTSPEGQAFSQQYPVTGLPCVILLRPDGSEVDRVEGYIEKSAFLHDAQILKDGIDPLPAMEVRARARPDSLPLLMELLEKYFNRNRQMAADSIYRRILGVDRENHATYAERAMARMARFQEFYLHDMVKTASTWQEMVNRFPFCSSVGGALDGSYRAMQSTGRGEEWMPWVCPILDKYPTLGQLQRAAVMVGLRYGLRGTCLAKAARASRSYPKTGKEAWADSIAVLMEGGASR